MKRRQGTVAAILITALFLAGCGTLKPEEYKGDFSAFVTANGSYDTSGDIIALQSVFEGEQNWKQFVFRVDYNSGIDDIYIVAQKQGVTVDDITVTTIGDSEQEMLVADFEKIKSPGESYGWETDGENPKGGKTSIVSIKPASKILYFVKDGKKQKPAGKYSAPSSADGYRISVWVHYEWNADDYDSLFYIGMNKVQ